MTHSDEPEPHYANIREILGGFIGKRVVDISQHDEEEFAQDGKSYVVLLFEDGNALKFFVGDDGFMHTEDVPEDGNEEI